MAEIKSKLSADRGILRNILPVDTPFVIGIYVGDICNFKCKYCAQSTTDTTGTKKDFVEQFMDMECFTKIVEQTKEFPSRVKTFMLSSMGEPTLNPHLPEMIGLLNKYNPTSKIEIVTNGSMLKPEFVRQIIDAGLTRIIISLQGLTAEKYKEICGYDIDMAEYIANLKYLYEYSRNKCLIHIKTIDICLDDGETEIFFNTFSPICDSIFIDTIVDTCQEIDYSSLHKNDNYKVQTRTICCAPPFYTLYILANGNVVSCCIPPYPCTYGNINDEKLVQIWNGDKRKSFLQMQLSGKRFLHKICNACTINDKLPAEEDCLDNNLEELLLKFQ